MERSVALKKLKKLLGESFSYRVDIKAPNADGRAEACEKKEGCGEVVLFAGPATVRTKGRTLGGRS